ncbi:MAG TPA: CapA family protein [Nitrososphaeraceae archaeon]|nr:CapA family protein [Nitrososphaeraceae archaeon]
MQILFAGDVMLGRLVNKVLANAQFTYVWGDTIDIIKRADFSLINLECPVSSKGKKWNKTFKVFHFRANLDAIQVLNSASIDYVSLANNHILDYDVEALLDTLDILDKNNISHSGAGRNLKEAMKPAILEKKLKPKPSNNNNPFHNVYTEKVNNNDNIKNTIRIGIISLTDNEPEWEAKDDLAGINYIPATLDPDRYYYRLQNYIEQAKTQSDLVIVSSHIGPHFRETPSVKYVNFAHKIIDFGADIYWGHSNHMPQGIELYKHNNNNKIILYDCGDFIDDYAIDSNYRNDLSFIFLLHFLIDKNSKLSKNNNTNNNGNILLQNSMIELIPTKISNFMVNTIPTDDNDADLIIKRMAKTCSFLGTKYFIDNKKKRIKIFL